MRSFFIWSLVLFMVIGSAYLAIAEEKTAQPKEKIVTKTVMGQVAGISQNFIAVDYSIEGGQIRELALKMAKDVKTEHKKIKEIGIGDTVNVVYEETIMVKEGEQPKEISRQAKIVEFIAPAKKESAAAGALVSQGQ